MEASNFEQCVYYTFGDTLVDKCSLPRHIIDLECQIDSMAKTCHPKPVQRTNCNLQVLKEWCTQPAEKMEIS